MTITCYRLSIPKHAHLNFDNPHFELRFDDANRPLHIALRDQAKKIILNSMENDAWQQEELGGCYPESLHVIYLEVREESATIIANGNKIHFDLKIPQDAPPLTIASVGILWESQTDIAKLYKIDKQEREDIKFKLFNKYFLAPNDIELWALNRWILAPSHDPANEYRAFLGAHSLTPNNNKITIVDAFKGDLHPALMVTALLREAEVIMLPRVDEESKSVIRSFTEKNNIKNLTQTSIKPNLNELLSDGSVLLQGDDIFEIFGDEISNLSAESRSRLSIFSKEKDIIPGNIALPCRNAYISCGEEWKFRHSASYSRQDQRDGLDIVISSYNGGDYVIECAKSLLCENRDDIRIIFVDDGSSDDSADIAEKVFAGDLRVSIVRKHNGGCASARNYGRIVSKSTHIAFVDADDIVTPNFFADLYDLSLYTGAEITSGGFDFYDTSLENPYYPSYEEQLVAEHNAISFKGMDAIKVESSKVIQGQPTIWRKVYRRDFLDAKNIYFPENIRAYDDYIFHITTSTEASNFYMLPQHLYHYRQHPAQDIKQGDERHFYMLQMFHALLRQSIEKSWPNFSPYAMSIIDSINWSSSKLKPELVDSFLVAGAKLCVVIRKTYGEHAIPDSLIKRVAHPDFIYHVQQEWKKVEALPPGAHWVNFPTAYDHPDLVRMRSNLLKAK